VLRREVSLEELRASHGRGYKIGTNAVRRRHIVDGCFPKTSSIFVELPTQGSESSAMAKSSA
jgi:hypothetical protein